MNALNSQPVFCFFFVRVILCMVLFWVSDMFLLNWPLVRLYIGVHFETRILQSNLTLICQSVWRTSLGNVTMCRLRLSHRNGIPLESKYPANTCGSPAGKYLHWPDGLLSVEQELSRWNYAMPVKKKVIMTNNFDILQLASCVDIIVPWHH
jgi:hypothetical protein